MEQNFIIKKGESSLWFLIACSLFFITLTIWTQEYLILLPALLICSAAVLVHFILYLRWLVSFAVFVDTEKKELVLNHTLYFRKKKISIENIKEIDTQKGNIILSETTFLSYWQKIVCKNKKMGCYIVRFEIIHPCERKQLIELLLSLKP
ncbi:MAG: hypothetical protein GX330_07675 [Bacteroidales bacterium]|nr:hypothetical protein [Bacteroidales bacterium]